MKAIFILLMGLLLVGCDDNRIGNGGDPNANTRFATSAFAQSEGVYTLITDKSTGCQYLSRSGGGITLLANTCKEPNNG